MDLAEIKDTKWRGRGGCGGQKRIKRRPSPPQCSIIPGSPDAPGLARLGNASTGLDEAAPEPVGLSFPQIFERCKSRVANRKSIVENRYTDGGDRRTMEALTGP